jgi:polyhydroxyalkanoate synthesis regulator phasin
MEMLDALAKQELTERLEELKRRVAELRRFL